MRSREPSNSAKSSIIDSCRLHGVSPGFCQEDEIGPQVSEDMGLAAPRRAKQHDSRTPGELVSLVEPVGFQVEHVELLVDGANALYLKGIK